MLTTTIRLVKPERFQLVALKLGLSTSDHTAPVSWDSIWPPDCGAALPSRRDGRLWFQTERAEELLS